MGDKLPVGIFIYFIFIFVMLVVITILAVLVLVDTATKIDTIRKTIIVTSIEREVQSRIAQFKDDLNEVDQSILMQVNNLSLFINQSYLSFMEAFDENERTNQTLNTVINLFQANLTRWSNIYLSLIFRVDVCNLTVTNASAIRSNLDQFNQEVNDYIAVDRFQTNYRAIQRVILPDGAMIYGGVNFHPNLTAKIRLFPNSNDYLASYGRQMGSSSYPASPFIASYSQITAVASPSKPTDLPSIEVADEGDNRTTNVRINTFSQFEQPTTVLNHDLRSYFVVPYEVYT